MLGAIIMTVGVLLLYACIAMGVHHWCDADKEDEPNNFLRFGEEYTDEYSLID